MPTMPTSNTVTMTVNLDKTASLSRQNFGSQGEDIEITVVVPVGLSGSGYDAYVDFIQPDGLAYFKGPYDCSSGTFSFFIGVLDSLMDKDGDLSWQFLLAETDGSDRTVKWAANRYKNPIYASVGATSSAILPYVPQMVYPDDYPASLVSLEDAAGIILANEVEGALHEVAKNIDDIEAGGAGNPFATMIYIGTAPIVESGSGYVKFADGTMICTGQKTQSNFAVTTAWGNIFISGSFAFDNFPVAFHAAPNISFTVGQFGSSGDSMLASDAANPATTTNPGSTKVARGTSATIATLIISYIAVGRWKA